MNVKSVVKVMNFHSLLHVDQARRRADRYGAMKDELESMMRIVLNNRNLRLDKHIKLPDPNQPVLRIYLGSDLGFCGSVNSSVSKVIAEDEARNEKIVVGKKLRKPKEVSYYVTRDDLAEHFADVKQYLERAVRERCWSAVELVYNHYYNLSSIKQEVQRIYPLELKEQETTGDAKDDLLDDFMFEGDPDRMIEDMVIEYLVCELKIAATSSYASENIMRQNATSESLKKLDEQEAEELRIMRKERSLKAVQKTTDNYIKQKSLERT